MISHRGFKSVAYHDLLTSFLASVVENKVGVGDMKSLDQLIPYNFKPKFVVEEVQEATGVGREKFGVVGANRDPGENAGWSGTAR
ncbi:hypothetical protein PGT21_035317 [Puccinia graminis f. sp. tritici]|uniref:Uncharacterized protein n=1 Tax=Puccinia graminis f. sp. tritici TaxID=56615 RepID=A0A5B0NSR0_PUCGR|nr:hypothetical protein PGTUg99_036632 [Puccinia graminis f. sp. tritici]KAA1091534.1 hypothetical protein PGT21_035317 [Puccinia graminis f. sp. tritici]